MFTGLIQDVGIVRTLERRDRHRILSIASCLTRDNMAIGESVSCDGACLTVVAAGPDQFSVEASQETARRTILEGYRAGARVNLERALKVGERLGGHYVTAHVDDTGVVDCLRSVGESRELTVRFDVKHDPLVVEKGSIAVNGVSLTVNGTRAGWLRVNLVPYTWKQTTLGGLKANDRVNLEFDLIGKYVLRMHGRNVDASLTSEKLLRSGW